MARQNVGVDQTFAEVFSSAVKQRGLALDRLCQRLAAEGVPVSIATLSYWQTGRSVPTRARSLGTVEVMERILEVPTGTLTAHTNHYLRHTEPTWQDQLPSDTGRQLLAEMGYDRPSVGIHPLFTHDQMCVGEQGQEASQRCTSLTKMERSLRGWPTMFLIEGGNDTLITIDQTENCHLGEHVAIPEMGLFVGELLFDQPQERGSIVRTSYTVHWEGNTAMSNGFTRPVPKGLHAATLEVAFHPDAIPSRIQAVWRTGLDVPDDQATVLGEPVLHDGRATFSSDALRPGVVGLTWHW